MPEKLHRFLRYTGVNIGSMVVDYTVFLTLTDLLGAPILQSVVAYSIASMANYWLTKRHVFVHDMSHKSEHRLFMEFFATGALGLALTALIIRVTVHVMQLTPFEGKTISVLVCFVMLYFVRSRLVFNEKPDTPAANARAPSTPLIAA